MEIKATTVYDEKNLKDFICFSIFRGKRFKTRRVVCAITLPILIVVFAFVLPLSPLQQFPNLLWISSLIMMLLIWYGISAFFSLPAKMRQSGKKLLGTRISYIFRDDQFFVESKNPSYWSHCVMRYSFFDCVYETKDYLYLLPNQNSYYVIDLHTISMNDVQALREAISAHLPPKKYVICKE